MAAPLREIRGETHAQEKAKWKTLRLVKTGSRVRDLQLVHLETFEADFNAQKVQVVDRSVDDEYDIIFSQLPATYQYKLTAEKIRRNNESRWVRAFPDGEIPLMVSENLKTQ